MPNVFACTTAKIGYTLAAKNWKTCIFKIPFIFCWHDAKNVVYCETDERQVGKMTVTTYSPAQTESFAATLAKRLPGGTVLALYGDLGMGKTAFVRGLASALCPDAQVSSPTFSLVNVYGGTPPLVHFDMYRVTAWDDLYATGFFDYLEQGCILAVEWSEHIEAALPADAVRITLSRVDDNTRKITVEGMTL